MLRANTRNLTSTLSSGRDTYVNCERKWIYYRGVRFRGELTSKGLERHLSGIKPDCFTQSISYTPYDLIGLGHHAEIS